jgi:hypothetical protein
MINSDEIKPDMPVLCSKNKQFATVDHMDNGQIKLKKDPSGHHHYIPLAWVQSVDQSVHIDRPGAQAMREWTSRPNK